MPANRTHTQNTIPTILPPGIPLNTFTRQINISPGPPEDNSAPPAAIPRIITNAANKAAIVSNTATFLAEVTTFSLSLRYEPQITVPLPAIDSEKNA